MKPAITQVARARWRAANGNVWTTRAVASTTSVIATSTQAAIPLAIRQPVGVVRVRLGEPARLTSRLSQDAEGLALRTVVGLALGLVFAFLVVPALGFDEWYARAAIVLFLLPAPFVIPVYHRGNPAFVSSVLTLSTLVSIVLISVLAVVGLA